MNYTYFFQYNIPADNQLNGQTDRHINILAEWDDNSFYQDGSPMVNITPVNFTFLDCMLVKDWIAAYNDIKRLAQNHFAELAKQKRIEDAQNILKGINGVAVV